MGGEEAGKKPMRSWNGRSCHFVTYGLPPKLSPKVRAQRPVTRGVELFPTFGLALALGAGGGGQGAPGGAARARGGSCPL